MKKDLYNFLKSLENLEIKDLKDLNNLDSKLRLFKSKIMLKPENIGDRLKINMIDNILKANEQEKVVFTISSRLQVKSLKKVKPKNKIVFEFKKQ